MNRSYISHVNILLVYVTNLMTKKAVTTVTSPYQMMTSSKVSLHRQDRDRLRVRSVGRRLSVAAWDCCVTCCCCCCDVALFLVTLLRNLRNLRYLGGLHQDVWVCCWRREDEETTSLESKNIKRTSWRNCLSFTCKPPLYMYIFFQVNEAFDFVSNRKSIGKVVLNCR